MKIFVVRCIISDMNGEWSVNDSAFSSEELAHLRIEELSKKHPSTRYEKYSFDIQEFILNKIGEK